MAKAKKVNYTEGELLFLLGLTRITSYKTPLMERWLAVKPPLLSIGEQETFDRILPLAVREMDGWGEEDLKMLYISQILPLGHIYSNGRYKLFHEKTVSGIVDNIPLSTKTDFMIATGALDLHQHPYFHFQEYKSSKPSGDSMAQLLEAMLIGQEKNKNGKPIYGCEVVGANWRFVTLEKQTYCISKFYDSTEKEHLLAIIAILRHFKHILETELLDDI